MSARDCILAWAAVAVLGIVGHPALAERLDQIETPMQLEAPETELPDPVRYDDLLSLSRRLWRARCRTELCNIWYTTIGLYYDSYIGRGPQGSDCMLGLRRCPDKYRLTSKRLDREINAYPAWHPQLCAAIAAVAARDDGTAAKTHPLFGAYTLDLARRLTTPKLACLTRVWRAFRPGPYRAEMLGEAISLCHDERASIRACATLYDATIDERSGNGHGRDWNVASNRRPQPCRRLLDAAAGREADDAVPA